MKWGFPAYIEDDVINKVNQRKEETINRPIAQVSQQVGPKYWMFVCAFGCGVTVLAIYYISITKGLVQYETALQGSLLLVVLFCLVYAAQNKVRYENVLRYRLCNDKDEDSPECDQSTPRLVSVNPNPNSVQKIFQNKPALSIACLISLMVMAIVMFGTASSGQRVSPWLVVLFIAVVAMVPGMRSIRLPGATVQQKIFATTSAFASVFCLMLTLGDIDYFHGFSRELLTIEWIADGMHLRTAIAAAAVIIIIGMESILCYYRLLKSGPYEDDAEHHQGVIDSLLHVPKTIMKIAFLFSNELKNAVVNAAKMAVNMAFNPYFLPILALSAFTAVMVMVMVIEVNALTNHIMLATNTTVSSHADYLVLHMPLFKSLIILSAAGISLLVMLTHAVWRVPNILLQTLMLPVGALFLAWVAGGLLHIAGAAGIYEFVSFGYATPLYIFTLGIMITSIGAYSLIDLQKKKKKEKKEKLKAVTS